jgi:hypothetical protein
MDIVVKVNSRRKSGIYILKYSVKVGSTDCAVKYCHELTMGVKLVSEKTHACSSD